MSRIRILSSLAALALVPALHAQQFVYNATALPAQSLWTDGVALVDVDGDTDLDILFANGSTYGGTGSQGASAQHLFLNNGSGVFTAAHASLNVADFNAKMVIGEDFDNDGDMDLFYASGSTGSPPRLLVNNGLGVFTDKTATNVPALALKSFCVCAGDVDNDGDADVVVNDGGTFGGTPSQARLLLNNGSAVFTDVTATKMPVDLFNCQDECLLDVDGDLDIDIALSGKGSATLHGRLYINDGTGIFTVATGLDNVGTGGTYEMDYADLDGDGDFDAAVQSITSSTEGWARNVGNFTPWTKTTFVGPNQDDNEVVPFDYDADGDMDVLMASLGSAERIYANDGAGNFTHMPGVVQAIADSSLDAGVGDLDGDGRIDIVTAEGESGNFTNKVYFNNGAIDALAPVYVEVETPANIGSPFTVFRAQLKDQIADDGQIGVKVTYAYTTVGAGSGAGVATHMGHGLYRASVPSIGATSVSLTWAATDEAGNLSNNGPIVVGGPPSPWTDLGRALAGVTGDPALVGTGPLTAGSAGSLALTNAAPSAACLLFVSLSSSPVPFKGGTLCPVPWLVTLPLATNAAGSLTLPWASWPSGLSGATLFFQYAIADGAAIHGASLSNCEEGDVP
ncbi:MAG TPA: VCBS repeat-containing protein [Planctomycetota bacterium]|nr:VCBS repeat-containing protein [Planctomycetota bacterium]